MHQTSGLNAALANLRVGEFFYYIQKFYTKYLTITTSIARAQRAMLASAKQRSAFCPTFYQTLKLDILDEDDRHECARRNGSYVSTRMAEYSPKKAISTSKRESNAHNACYHHPANERTR